MKEVSGTSRKAMEDTSLEKSGQVMKNVPTCAIGSLLHPVPGEAFVVDFLSSFMSFPPQTSNVPFFSFLEVN